VTPIAATVIFAIIVVWVLLHLKTSRPDAKLITGLHSYRRVMSYIMIGRNESIVYFDSHADASALVEYIEKAQSRFDVDISHCLVGAALIGLNENPSMNRFSTGRRLWQRNSPCVSFSMKRKQLDTEAKLATVKLESIPAETFEGLCGRINAAIGTERSGKKTYADKEFDLLEVLPRPIMRGAVQALKTLDYFNILPAGFMANDPLFTSMFIANLGSLGMGAGFHHLYEWGNCPLFMMVGQLEDRPVAQDGEIVVRKTLHIRWSYDERIDDGLNARFGIDSVVRALEHPFEYFGCLAGDGSDVRPLDHVEESQSPGSA